MRRSGLPSLRTVRLVAAKELLEALRDRRTLFVALVLPVLLYPLMMVAVGPLIGQQRQKMQQEVQPIAVTGPGAGALALQVLDGAPELAEDDAVHLRIVATPEPETALRSGEIALWIHAGADVPAALAGDATAEITVHRDSSDDDSRIAFGKWQDALSVARERLVRERLERHGLPPSVVEPLHVEEVVDMASAEQRAGYSFGRMLALILVLMTLSSSFYPAVDVVAGEKERGTMETLLVAPCGRAELVLGKYLAVLAVTLTAAVLNLFSMWLTMGPLVGTMGVAGLEGLQISPRDLLGILALLLPLGALFAALSIGLSTLARSVKEAQHYLTPLFLLVMPLAMVVVIPNVELTPTLAAVPITNVVLFFRDLMVGKLEPWAAVTVLATTIAAAALALWGTVRLFLREETLFRGPEGTGSLLTRPAPRALPPPGAAILYFTVSIALVWYLQPLLPSDDLLLNVVATQALVVALPCVLLTWWLRLDLAATFRLRVPRPSVLLLAVPIGLTVPVVNGFLQRLLIGEVPEEGPFHQLAETFERMIVETPAPLLVLLFAVLPAVFEELVFRGFVLSGFWNRDARSRPGVAAVLGAAVLFALFHIYPEKWPGTFVVGAVLGTLAVASRSVWPAIVAHLLNNATLVLAGKVDADHPLRVLHDPDQAGHTTGLVVSAVVLAASLIAVAVILRRTPAAPPSAATPAELDAPRAPE